jgi:hypothetical protein
MDVIESRHTLIIKSTAVPAGFHLAGTWTLTGPVNFGPNVGSADNDWMMYDNARHNPCCSKSKYVSDQIGLGRQHSRGLSLISKA